jgi:hypothetical protein
MGARRRQIECSVSQSLLLYSPQRKFCSSLRATFRRMLTMTRFRYFLVAATILCWVASEFLFFISPLWDYFRSASLICWLAVLYFALSALVRRRWKDFAIFSVTCVVIFFVGLGLPILGNSLQVLGLRVRATSLEQYLSGCEVVAFVEKDTKQQIGKCEVVSLPGNHGVFVFYDTTGQFIVPPAARTEGWKNAMYNFSPKWFFIEKAVGVHVFDNFYAVFVPVDEFDGS